MDRLRCPLLTGVLAVAVVAAAAGPATAAQGGNSANAKQCQKGGWQSLSRSDGSRFSNEGDCTSYAAHGGTFVTAWQAACEANGGTFSQQTLVPPAYRYRCDNVPIQAFADQLIYICQGYPDYVSWGYDRAPGQLETLTGYCTRSGAA